MCVFACLFKISKYNENDKREIEENIPDGNKNYEMLKLMKDSCDTLERFITILYVFFGTLTLIFLYS